MTTNAAPWNPPVGRLFVREERGVTWREMEFAFMVRDGVYRRLARRWCSEVTDTHGGYFVNSDVARCETFTVGPITITHRAATDDDLRHLLAGWPKDCHPETWIDGFNRPDCVRDDRAPIAADELQRLRRVVAEVMAEREKGK
jgi:hypothetical protein